MKSPDELHAMLASTRSAQECSLADKLWITLGFIILIGILLALGALGDCL